jgi:hypothetical protein
MKEFFKMALIEPFQDNGWLWYTIGILMWLLFLFIVGLLLWLSVYLIDSSFLPIKEKGGIVTNKYIVPAHTTITLVSNGKTSTPIIIHPPQLHGIYPFLLMVFMMTLALMKDIMIIYQ